MKKVLLLFAILTMLVIPVMATTPNSVSFTGVPSTDFAADEKIFSDSSSDSAWGAGDELYNLYITWDASSLYLAVDGVRGGSNTNDIWIGASDGSSCNTTAGVTWGKLFTTSGWNPDYSVHDSGGFTSLQSIASNVSSAEIINSGSGLVRNDSTSGILEVAIPWSTIGLQSNQILRLVATISGGGYDGPDSMPAQSPEPNGNGTADVLNYWLQLSVADGSGVPLSGISPNTAVSTVPVELSDFTAD